MKIASTARSIRMTLQSSEAPFIADVLVQLQKEYEVPPQELESKISEVWYSKKGHQGTGSSKEEIAEWNHSLFEFRGENARKIQDWIQLLRRESYPVVWDVPLQEVDSLLMILNDYRLSLAARYEVAESEMEHDLTQIEDARKRLALLQIHLLGIMMDEILQCLK